MEMWTERKDFSMNVKKGWHLHLSKTVRIPVAEGFYYGCLSSKEKGFEIRTDQNFISKKPLYYNLGDPHPKLLDFLSAKQEVYHRDECMGFVPNTLRLQKIPKLSLFMKHLQERLENISEFGETDCLHVRVSKGDRNKQYYLSRSKYRYIPPYVPPFNVSECMYLGQVCNQSLTLSKIFDNALYAVHTNSKTPVGYLITIGIRGADLERFKKDDLEVAVTLPSDKNEAKFISLLGSQNMLRNYSLDDLDGRVDWMDLEWFDKISEHYWKERGESEYVNLKKRFDISYSSLRPGTYVIEPCDKKIKFFTCLDLSKNKCFYADCKAKGQDSLGREYKFPDKIFKFRLLENQQEIDKCKNYLIEVPENCFLCFWDGNLHIKRNRMGRQLPGVWIDSALFRMYTDLDVVESHIGDLTEYDLDPDKTLAKLEKALRKAFEDYHTLPPKETCCDECDNREFRKRCPKESIQLHAL